MLSLKAGGTGLNLTAASHVVLYDRWWNPAVEDQARDRAWRIGQTRTVISHRLVCPGTVDERVEEVVAGKRRIADLVLPKSSSLADLDSEQLRVRARASVPTPCSPRTWKRGRSPMSTPRRRSSPARRNQRRRSAPAPRLLGNRARRRRRRRHLDRAERRPDRAHRVVGAAATSWRRGCAALLRRDLRTRRRTRLRAHDRRRPDRPERAIGRTDRHVMAALGRTRPG